MPSLRNFFVATLLGLCLSIQPSQGAELPSSAQVQSTLDGLADRKLPEAEQKALQKTLEQTLSFIDQADASDKALAQLKIQLASAPQQINDAQRELTRLQSSPSKPVVQRYGSATAAQLEQLLSERTSQLSTWQAALSDANSLLISSQTRPERAQAEISTSQIRLQAISSLLKNGKDNGKVSSPEQRTLLQAEQAALNAQLLLRRSELAGNSLLQDIGSSQRDLLTERITRSEQETRELQALINDKRRLQSEKTVAELSAEVQKAGSDSLLANESAANLKTSDYLLRATTRLNELTEQNLQTKQQQDNLNQSDQALDEQISVLKGSLLLAKILNQQKQALPQIRVEKNLADEIADIRLYQFELGQQREKISSPSLYVDQLLASQSAEQVTPELRKALLELVVSRSALLEQLNRELNELLNQSITLQLSQKQLQSTAKTLRTTLDEQLFWIPSNKPLDLAWLKQIPHQLERQLGAIPWGSALKELWAGLINQPLLFLPLLLLIGVLLWKRSYLYQKLDELHQDIGHFKRDSQLHTPLALLLNLLLALPIGLFLALCGFALQIDARGQNASLGAALMQMAETWMLFYTTYRILSPGGVAELHFRWNRPQVAFLHSKVRLLGLIVMALVAVSTVAEHQQDVLDKDVMGIGIVLTCFLGMAWLLTKMVFSEPIREHASPLRQAIGIGFIALPLGLSVAVGMGYFYTSLKLSDRLIETLYLLIVWLMIEATFVRGLGVAARRLAYQRAQSKRQAQAKDGADGSEVGEEPALHIDQVNEQSLRLINLALFALFLGGLYWVWADLISVFAYLDNVTLYEYSSGTGDTASMVPISLSDLLGALVIIVISAALARNLPGLLEVLVLSRLNLGQGSAYATTTLLSYAIAALGFVATLSTLGVSWDKLQWLVAALSLGIGFGMQEIFANFISGLIILFERPVRIGDTVTIGALSGTVSRIQIRATTITDFDRKEIIVPNKTFVTDQLINWSLTDTVTRVVLNLGLAYETDLPLARKLIMQAVDDNVRVLREPEPQLFFVNIGASAFNFDLRFHVRELGDRLPASDELLSEIVERFRANNVEMAFNQMDIFVKNLQGQEAQLDSTQQSSAALPKTAAEPGDDA
ncbi:MAG: mechanosensitive channel MscK [Pseudomonas sp.]|uniref:mechanosensitive channel MscK n=1 Tax=Pseudomonas sp. TaxID=306 RepID=UPI003BB6B1F9